MFSRARDSRVFFVTARLFRPKTRLKIKSRWKNSGMLLRRGAVRFVPVRFAPREFSLAVHRLSIFAPRILKITAVERIPSHRDTATRISRGESRGRAARRYSFCPARPLFPRPLCAKPEVALVFNDRVTTGKAVATNAKPRGCNEGNARNYKNQLKRRGERNSTRKRQ